jgi:hypothetical protein
MRRVSKRVSLLLLVLAPFAAVAQNQKPPTTLRGVLVDELRTTPIGQILYVRKLEGAWDPGKGVR